MLRFACLFLVAVATVNAQECYPVESGALCKTVSQIGDSHWMKSYLQRQGKGDNDNSCTQFSGKGYCLVEGDNFSRCYCDGKCYANSCQGYECISKADLEAAGAIEASWFLKNRFFQDTTNDATCRYYESWDDHYCVVGHEGGIALGSCNCNVPGCGCGSDSDSNPDAEVEVTTTTTTTTTTEAPASGSSDDCEAGKTKYAQFDDTHTMKKYCGFGDACPNNQVTARVFDDADKTAMVKAHNDYRRRVAKGEETGADNYLGDAQPGATNMVEMTWDDDLAEVAQRYADQCVFGHDENRDTPEYAAWPGVGQNAYISSSWTSGRSSYNLTAAADAWYSEVNYFNKASISSFKSVPSQAGKMIGHYTQMVWASTKEVGCGYSVWTTSDNWTKTLVICNYGAMGNILNQPIYEEGSAASNCPSGTSASDGLCA